MESAVSGHHHTSADPMAEILDGGQARAPGNSPNASAPRTESAPSTAPVTSADSLPSRQSTSRSAGDGNGLLLRRVDQITVAGLLLFALLALGAYWLARGGHAGRLVEIDHVDPLSAQFTIDVNTADWPEFMTLPQIGETMARRIVAYRQQNGPFRSIDDLRHVRGIGPKTMERLRPYLRVNDQTRVAGHSQ